MIDGETEAVVDVRLAIDTDMWGKRTARGLANCRDFRFCVPGLKL